MTPRLLLTVAIGSEQEVLFARQRTRQLAELLGFERQDQTRLATAVSELGRNAFNHAGGGTVQFSVHSSGCLLQFVVSDKGPGIADVEAVMNGTYQSRTGPGTGMLGAQRLMDSFAIESSLGRGTRVTIGKSPSHRRAGAAVPLDLGQVMLKLSKILPLSPASETVQQNQELMASLAELQIAVTARDDFLSMVSHEIKTPVTAVQILIAILRRRLQRGEVDSVVATLGQRFDLIHGHMTRLVQMLDTLLDLNTLNAGLMVIKAERVDVSQLCREIAARYAGEEAIPCRPLTTVLPHDAIVEGLDRVRVDQVLTNLLTNAFKYGETGGVELGLQATDAELTLWVRDAGPGICEADQVRIFERFERGSKHRDRNGFGVGLWIVRRIVEALGGQIRVDSVLGKGSCFTVSLTRGVPTQIP